MLRLDHITRQFGPTTAVDDLTLDVAGGEFVSLLGPSGCGKTTTLRLIAGFETPNRGRVLLRDQDVTDRPAHRRGIGMVFQNYALFPHLTVFENVAFGLREQRRPKPEIAERVSRALERVELGGYGDRKVQQLSGGQQQRVALARALAPEPTLVLLDEPLSNLDAALREKTRREIRALLKSVGITALFVTHDQEEAFALSDRIALLDRGKLQQYGTPEELYAMPANAFVARFVGRGVELPATLAGFDHEYASVELPGGATWRARPIENLKAEAAGRRVNLLIRPEALVLRAAGPMVKADSVESTGANAIVTDRRFAGGFVVYTVRLGNTDVLVQGSDEFRTGDQVTLAPRSPDHLFVVAG